MTEITLIPIFNQAAPGVWDDFLRVQVATMTYNYDAPLSAHEIEAAASEYIHDWNDLKSNFAFGAYDGTHMVGYVNGFIKNSVAVILNMHVLPEYQGHHIGRRLFSAAAGAASVSARRVELKPLYKAKSFYEHQGCQYDGDRGIFVKDVAKTHCHSAPVFYCSGSLKHKCEGFTYPTPAIIDSKSVNRLHNPMFIYRNIDSIVTGCALYNGAGYDIHTLTPSVTERITRSSLLSATRAYEDCKARIAGACISDVHEK